MEVKVAKNPGVKAFTLAFNEKILEALSGDVSFTFEHKRMLRSAKGIILATMRAPDYSLEWDDGEIELLKRVCYGGGYLKPPMLGPNLPPLYSQVTTRSSGISQVVSSVGFLNAEGRGNDPLVINAEELTGADPQETTEIIQNFLDSQAAEYGLRVEA